MAVDTTKSATKNATEGAINHTFCRIKTIYRLYLRSFEDLPSTWRATISC